LSENTDTYMFKLLSDGYCTAGVENVGEIVQLVEEYFNDRNSSNPMVIDTVTFMSGGGENSTERDNATNLLNNISSVTGGNHQFINWGQPE